MENDRFVFESAVQGGKGSRHTCPNPNHKGNPQRQFTRYVDQETGELLPDHVGACNNTKKCGYKYPWWDFLRDNPDYLKNNSLNRNDYQPRRSHTPPPPKPVSYIEPWIMERSLKSAWDNNFIKSLSKIFPPEIISGLIDKYKIGTVTKPWNNSPVFWQIDQAGNIRSGKIIPYDPVTGNRGKGGRWVHNLLEHDGQAIDFNLQQCFYGEHLLSGADRIAVVEGEKTAIIASVFYPEYTWISTGGETGFTEKKCEILKGKNVTLFPDKGCLQHWRNLAVKFGLNAGYSELVEKDPHLANGKDLADLLILPENTTTPEPKTNVPEYDLSGSLIDPAKGFPTAWI